MSQPSLDAECEVVINGEPRPIPSGCTVKELILLLDMAGRNVAVAVNRDVVPRSMYGDLELASNDRIEILEAVGGG